MDLDLSSIASSSSKLPQTATTPMTEVARECDHALRSLDREKYAEALKILESTLSRHSASPVINATRSIVYYKMASRISDSTSKKLEHLVKALESSRRAAALAPTSTSCALFNAQVLSRLGKHEAALQECQRGVSIERPEEPGSTRRIPREREMTIRWRLWELKARLDLMIIVFEPGKQRDKWKLLLEDKSLVEVKNEIETLHLMKKRIVAARSEDFIKEKKVDKKEQWKQISRVKPFWTGMPVDRKKAMRRIRIQELQEHFAKNNRAEMDLAEKFLQEALDFAKEAKSWRFWKCFSCGDRFLTDKFIDHIIHTHLGTFWGHFQSMIPYKTSEPFIKRVEDGVWKPVESSWAANIIKVDSNILLHDESWVFCDDSNREGLIREIRAKLLFFLRSGCFGSSHLLKLRSLIKDLLRNHILEKKKVDQMLSINQFRPVCFLEVPELKRVLEWLEDLPSIFALPCIAETLPDDQDFYRDVRDRVIFNTEFSDILLDERLLLAETSDLKDESNSVGDSSTCLTDLEPDDDAFLYWLWERDPPIQERLQTWESVRETGRSRGLELYKILEAEFRLAKKLFEMKLQFSRYEQAFERVEKMYLEVRKRRLRGVPLSYLERWSDIEADGEAPEDIRSFELDVLWSILIVTREDTGIETEFQRQSRRLDHQLFLLDAFIPATDIALSRTCEALKKLCAYDYRFIVVPMLRSFVQKRLEDMVNEDAAEKPSAAVRSTLLEELALDAPKNTVKSGGSPKQGQKKSKNKKKKKHRRMPEDAKATASVEEQHSIQEENDGKDPDFATGVPASIDHLSIEELERMLEEALERRLGKERLKRSGLLRGIRMPGAPVQSPLNVMKRMVAQVSSSSSVNLGQSRCLSATRVPLYPKGRMFFRLRAYATKNSTQKQGYQELKTEQEYQARKVDEDLWSHWRVEKEAKEKSFAESN